MKTKGYSLWLMPKGKAYKKFSQLIKKLAKENNALVFEPHITILNVTMLDKEEVIRRATKLVIGQKPFLLTLQNIDYQDNFFRTFFVKADISDELLSLRKKVDDAFGIEYTTYMPHLSILYGEFPSSTKDKIIKNIGRDQAMTFEIDSLILIKGGEIDKWRIIKEFPFKSF